MERIQTSKNKYGHIELDFVNLITLCCHAAVVLLQIPTTGLGGSVYILPKHFN